jgi:hypothetical protein
MSDASPDQPAVQPADNPGPDPVSADSTSQTSNAGRWTKLGVGAAAIGSAAIVAALLYANRPNRNDRS